MILEKFTCGPLETNCYIFGNEKLAVIDPAPSSINKILEKLQEESKILEKILLTHSHWDHIGDCKSLAEATNALIYVHKNDAENLEYPGADGIPLLFPVRGTKPDELLEKEGDILVGSLRVQVLFTPGHSPGGVCYYIASENLLFSGDTLFCGSCGNLSFPTSNPESMWSSLKKLSKLPPETRVLPGHGADTTIEQEAWIEKAEELFHI